MRRSISSSQHLLQHTNSALSIYRSDTSLRSLFKPVAPQTRSRPHLNGRAYTRLWKDTDPRKTDSTPLESSWSTYSLVFLVACGSIYTYDYLTRAGPAHATTLLPAADGPSNSSDPFFTTMPVASGHRGNLTADQEAKLRELWVLTLKTFGVSDPSLANGTSTPTPSEEPHTEAAST
jgi:hypothetical protein